MAKKTSKESKKSPKKFTKSKRIAKAETSQPTQPQTISAAREVRLRKGAARPRALALLPQARKFFRKRKIHPRRIIPKVPPGAPRPDPQPTPRLSLAAPSAMELAVRGSRAALAAQPLASTDDLVFARNVQLGSVADNDTASNVCEPSVASKGDVVYYSGNWFAALSTDGGATFNYVDPYSAFPDPPGMGFCCDQVVHYINKIDTFVWLLQYTENASGANIQRLAFAKTADVANGNWKYWDIVPGDIGVPGQFLDYPDMAVGQNMLYVTTNVFQGNSWTKSILLRIPFHSIKNNNVTAQYVASDTNFNFRVAQYCGKTAYWASHENSSTLRVFSWRETSQTVNFKDVAVASWDDSDYESTTPDNRKWLNRADPRIVGATMAGTDLWFAWGAGRGGANNRPHPYIQIARLKANNLQLLQNINIWDNESAICYGALANNKRNEVAMSYNIGGGPRFPSAVVAILTGTRKDVVAAAGSRGPADSKWGDYLTVRRHYPQNNHFVATGYCLTPTSGGVLDATPRYMRFARSSDIP
jgi:hypothetical protein